jgi:hypothetical protein
MGAGGGGLFTHRVEVLVARKVKLLLLDIDAGECTMTLKRVAAFDLGRLLECLRLAATHEARQVSIKHDQT